MNQEIFTCNFLFFFLYNKNTIYVALNFTVNIFFFFSVHNYNL